MSNPGKLRWIQESRDPYAVLWISVSRVADHYKVNLNRWRLRGDTGYFDADFRDDPSDTWKACASVGVRLHIRGPIAMTNDEPLLPGRQDMPVVIPHLRIRMGKPGWAYLHVTFDGYTDEFALSYEYYPFDDMATWGMKLELGELPVCLEIDEEGPVVRLDALSANGGKYVVIRVKADSHERENYVFKVNRQSFAAQLRAELIRFFSDEFDQSEWNEEDFFLNRPGYVATIDRMASHPWFR